MIKTMNKNFLLFTAFFISFAAILNAQTNTDGDKIVMTIHDQKITKDEFERIYRKNNNDNTIDSKSLDEYVDLFINFKLKVIEAEQRGLDTTQAFISEFNQYTDQLARPYLTDPSIDELLMKEAYERMQKEINASHILISVPENAVPKDTAAAYKKAMELRKRITRGESFESVAISASDDPSAKKNQGNLGYFTAFQMVYPFETGVYSTAKGDISMPVRTRFGYHLIKVHDVRPASGKIKTAHIMIAVPQGRNSPEAEKAKEKIDSIYNALQQGADFATMAKEYSDDRGSAQKGGELPYFGRGRMVPEFEEAAFGLTSDSSISQAVQTDYGWHIIKLIEHEDVPDFETAKEQIKDRISKDQRANRAREVVIERLKEDYNFDNHPEALEDIYAIPLEKLKSGDIEITTEHKNTNLFTLDGNNYTQADFLAYLNAKKFSAANTPAVTLINKNYQTWVDDQILAYEKTKLPLKYPEYKYLLKEYHDGILLFELTDQLVWSKAVEDTTGLEAFYQMHMKDYMWGERAKAFIVNLNETAYTKDVKKAIKKYYKERITTEELLETVCKQDTTNSCISIKEEMYPKEEPGKLSLVSWDEDIYGPMATDEGKIVIGIKEIRDPEPKKLNEARGIITADYQNYLEKQWIEELREKYTFTVNEAVLDEIN